MFNGGWLYERLRLHLMPFGVHLPAWQHCREQIAYDDTAREAVYLIATQSNPAIDPNPAINWRETVRKYGRHAPTCPTSGPCACGFADVEKLLT